MGEQIIRCCHELLGVPGASLADIKTVYSHPQALSPVPSLPGRPQRVEAGAGGENTAVAAKKVAETQKQKTQAAIASGFAGECFGLDVLAEKIYSNEAQLHQVYHCHQPADLPERCR